jgi:adenylate kinase
VAAPAGSGTPRASQWTLVVLLGPPASGKGTQAGLLAAALHIPKISTGDVLRTAARVGTPMGREAQSFMDRGALVPDSVILGIMRETLERPAAANGAILDGVVRTVPQAEGLQSLLTTLGRALTAVVVLEIPDAELIRRVSSRTVCESCQTPYTNLEPGTPCPKCGGKLVRRIDDEPEAVRNRLVVYRAQTAPVITWYEQAHMPLVRIDGMGTPVVVRDRVLRAIQRAP